MSLWGHSRLWRRSLKRKDELIFGLLYDRGYGGSETTREFSAVIEKEEDSYLVASVPTLRGCHTRAKSLDVLMKRVKEAIELCLEVEEPTTTEFVGVQRIAVTARALCLPLRLSGSSRPLGNWVLKLSERRAVIIFFVILTADAW